MVEEDDGAGAVRRGNDKLGASRLYMYVLESVQGKAHTLTDHLCTSGADDKPVAILQCGHAFCATCLNKVGWTKLHTQNTWVASTRTHTDSPSPSTRYRCSSGSSPRAAPSAGARWARAKLANPPSHSSSLAPRPRTATVRILSVDVPT